MTRDGFNVFVEVGPNAHRAAAIDSILTGRPHVAVALDKQGKSAFDQLNRMIAVLATHRVPGLLPGALLHPKAYAPLPVSHPLQRTIVVNGRFLGLSDTDLNPALNLSPARRGDLTKARSPRPPVRPHTTPKVVCLCVFSIHHSTSLLLQAASRFPTEIPGSAKTSGAGAVTKTLTKDSLKSALMNLSQSVYMSPSALSFDVESGLDEILPCTPWDLGDPSFMETYGVDFPLYTGAMVSDRVES